MIGIAENLYDDGPRSMFADGLDEQDDPERAELLRVQCEQSQNALKYHEMAEKFWPQQVARANAGWYR